MCKPNVNLYDHSYKVFIETMTPLYHIHRRGEFDYPSIDEWLRLEWKCFKANNPELIGLKWDEDGQDWVHEYEGGLVRTIL